MINPVSIKAKLKNLAIKEGKQFDYLLNLYFICLIEHENKTIDLKDLNQ